MTPCAVIVSVILAAGRSQRMGRPKALLPHVDGATSFLAYLVRTCRAGGVATVLVVGREEDRALREEVQRAAATLVINPDPERGQLSSLIAGLDVAEHTFGADAIMLIPVDVPMITAAAVRVLVDRAAGESAPILRATAGRRHGHPVIFARQVFAELRTADPALGAKAVLHADPTRVVDVDVGEPGVVFDVDTPEDYRRAFGRSV
jgi:molybdenum cofactor cytidylyltransferase